MKQKQNNYNRFKPRLLRLGIAFAVGLLAFLSVLPAIARAIDNPDSTSINNFYMFRDLLEDDDWLLYVRYDVNYAIPPSESAEDTFEVVMYDPTEATLLGTRSLNYYQHNIISLYFTAEQVVALGLTWGDACIIKVRGSPSVFPVPIEGVNVSTRTLSAGSYKEGSELRSRLITEAGILQTDWGVTLLTGDYLNTTGMTYFTRAIPNLSTIAPTIAASSTTSVDANLTAWNTTGYEEELQAHQGPRLRAAIQDLANALSVSEDWMAIWLTSMAYLTFSGVVYAITKDPGISMLTGFPVIVGAAWLGVGLSMLTIVIAITIIAAILFGIHFILARFA